MRLMTNNPAKFIGLKGYGLAVIGRVPVLTPVTEENRRYLETKRTKMGHIYGSDLQGPLAEFIKPSVNKKESSDGESNAEWQVYLFQLGYALEAEGSLQTHDYTQEKNSKAMDRAVFFIYYYCILFIWEAKQRLLQGMNKLRK